MSRTQSFCSEQSKRHHIVWTDTASIHFKKSLVMVTRKVTTIVLKCNLKVQFL